MREVDASEVLLGQIYTRQNRNEMRILLTPRIPSDQSVAQNREVLRMCILVRICSWHASVWYSCRFRAPNGSHAKLRGQGPRADASAARRLPRMTFDEPSCDLQPS